MNIYEIRSETKMWQIKEQYKVNGEYKDLCYYDEIHKVSRVKAETPLEAAKEHIVHTLNYFLRKDESELKDGIYRNIVDYQGNQVYTHIKWKKFEHGDIELYNAYTTFKVFQLTKVDLF